MSDDVVQRARQALAAWPGEPITDDDRKVNAVIGSITVAQYDLVTDLLALVEVTLPTITAQRDDALAEVKKLRATIERVRDVHQPVDAMNTNAGRIVKVCSGCGTDGGNWAYWPCRTIRAIDEAAS